MVVEGYLWLWGGNCGCGGVFVVVGGYLWLWGGNCGVEVYGGCGEFLRG